MQAYDIFEFLTNFWFWNCEIVLWILVMNVCKFLNFSSSSTIVNAFARAAVVNCAIENADECGTSAWPGPIMTEYGWKLKIEQAEDSLKTLNSLYVAH